MEQLLLNLRSWPQAIMHIDGDAFFTSCEEAIHPELKGKPLITGGERGIVACASYAAKALGIKRGVPLHEARKLCPGLIVLPSDYETYSLFSRRMYNIVRRFTPQVEEYSIDEAFADLTGLRRSFHSSYETIAANIKREVERELGITFSVGLSLSKVLAKVASKHKKPAGFTLIPGRRIPEYIGELPVEKVWGIGPATTNYLWKMGIKTALEFARLPEAVVKKKFTKPGQEIWRELRGESVYPVAAEEKSDYASISKTKTFAPPSNNPEYLFAQLLRNLESACMKARRYNLAPRKLIGFLKMNDFEYRGSEMKLTRPSAHPMELCEVLRGLFDELYRKEDIYRATGVILVDLMPDLNVQYSLFESPMRADKVRDLYEAIDDMREKFGKHCLHLGAAHAIDQFGKGRRGTPTVREQTTFYGETKRKHLPLPVLHVKV